MSADEERTRVEEMLGRIGDLVAGLDRIADPAGRDAARELVDVVLDLHGLALARVMAIVAAAQDGGALIDKLAQDEQVKSVLLLYGLHPDDAATRIGRALDALRPRLHAEGVTITLGRVARHAAVVRVGGTAADTEALQREIEAAVLDAAPDLDEIAVEWLDHADVAEPAALAG